MDYGAVNHHDGPIEVCLPVRTATGAAEEITARALPGGRAVQVLLRSEQ